MNCPPPGELRRLLEMDPEAADAVAFAAHLEDCPACQRALDRIVETGVLPIRAVDAEAAPDGPASFAAVDGADFLRRLAQVPPGPELTFAVGHGGSEL